MYNQGMMQFQHLLSLVQSDFEHVNATLTRQLHSDVPLIEEIASNLIHSGGKRLRPLLVLLTAQAAGYRGEEHIAAATIIELIHTATLLHDDVVDVSMQRRGQPTSNAVWGNARSVLVGDFLYSRAFQMMTHLGCSARVLPVISDATSVIAEGEVLQLVNRHNPDLQEEDYFRIITCKTAKLFEVSAQLGALLAESSPEIESALCCYGLQLGLAFQLLDDMLDYNASSEEMGKDAGDDLADGKATLPVLYAMSHTSPETRDLIHQSLRTGGREHLEAIKEAIADSGAIAYTFQAARSAIDKALLALEVLPPSPYREGLTALAEFSLSRGS